MARMTALCVALVLGWAPNQARGQGVGGWTNPYGGNQPWTVEPVPAYFGTGNDYTVTQFSAVRLTGLPLSDLSSQALGLYLPVDKDGDGVADVLDGRPIYVQRDAMTTAQIALGANNVGRVAPGNEVEQGVRVGRFYLYYRYSLGGWAVHPTIGSEQAMLYCSTDAAFAHELEGLRTWQRVEGANFKADRRLTLVSVASGGEGAGPLTQGPGSPGLFSPPEARLQMASGEARAAVRQAGRFEPLGDLCPSGSFRDERTGHCQGCPRGRFGDSNELRGDGASCAECPAGRYRDTLGGKTLFDCLNCTAGKFSPAPGQASCAGACPLGKHSPFSGAVDASSCVSCPPSYHSEQCDRKDDSKQARRRRERENRERNRKSRAAAAASQAAKNCLES